ncbi:MAG: hypothetical protein ACI9IP_000689 [Arcticibacterium sp.]|jgi:hypothetical protein
MKRTVFLLLLSFVFSRTYTQKPIFQPFDLSDDPEARLNYEFNRIVDPATNTVPFNELDKARELMDGVISTMGQIPGIEWKERGPNNVGGRIRAMMFDPNDVTKKKVWAGGVAGGLWYNNDITDANSSWQNIFDFWDNMAVTCIAYDPSNTNIFYVGTGEGFGNSDAVQGGGIWKTSDGGVTWKRLAATKPDASAFSGVEYAFHYVSKIVVSSTGRVFAATRAGVWISTDQGKSFSVAATLPNSNGSTSRVSDLEIGTDDVVYAGFGYFSNTTGAIYKTNNAANDGISWSTITPPAPYLQSSIARTEIALAASTSGATQVVYAISHSNSSGRPISYFRKSADAGATWANLAIPVGAGPSIFGTQAWYDMILAVHPTNPDIIFAGGATHARSVDGGASWVNDYGYSNPVHPDHHGFAYRPSNPNEVIMANDGGVYYSTDWGDGVVTTPTYATRNKDLNITQFYAAAMKNVANDGYLIGGMQDNNSVKINGVYNTVGSSIVMLGGDGMISFIDQDNPGYQFVTTQTNNYHIADVDGNNVTPLTPRYGQGSFVNPADYHSASNTLYTYYSSSIVIKYVINSFSTYTTSFFQTSLGATGTFIKAGPTTNTAYIGTSSGYVYKYSGITDVDDNIPAKTTILSPAQIGGGTGTISCIEFGANENEILVTKSNYNVKSVFYTSDGGATWISKDEPTYGLPNIPVRYALFNPINRSQVLIATELGVWSTNDINATNPQWAPTNANLAHVRCDWLRYRSADNTVLVASHGRGLFTTQLNAANPCQTVMTLVAPYDNKTTGTTTFDKTERISATNKISGNANVTFKAANSIELLPTNPTDGTDGFSTEAGTVFYAYITGCEN